MGINIPSPIHCEHANECPARCPCSTDCYCRVEGSCKSRDEEGYYSDAPRGNVVEDVIARVRRQMKALVRETVEEALKELGLRPRVVKLGEALTPEKEKELLALLAQAEMNPNAWLIYDHKEDKDEKQAVVHALQKVELKEGDILVVKLGDPSSGWIPSPQDEKRILELMGQVLTERGLENKVSCLVYHYGIDFVVVTPPPPSNPTDPSNSTDPAEPLQNVSIPTFTTKHWDTSRVYQMNSPIWFDGEKYTSAPEPGAVYVGRLAGLPTAAFPEMTIRAEHSKPQQNDDPPKDVPATFA